MFSQFRHLVEELAPQTHLRQASDVSTSPSTTDQPDTISRTRSLDSQGARPISPLSSSQLAESALSSLRKSLGASSASVPKTVTASTSLPETETRLPKSNLEERLRAKFAIGDASNNSTPDVSTRASPSPMTFTAQHPLSPTSTPLPESPGNSPSPELKGPLSRADAVAPPSKAPFSPQPLTPHPLSVSIIETQTAKESSDAGADDARYLEADIPLPPQSPFEELMIGNDFMETSSLLEKNPNDVDALQERLRLVEQRFADVSTSFKRLQAEKIAADKVVRELTPLEGLQNVEELRDYLQNMNMKTEISQDELQRLNGKLIRQEDRIEELRDTHRLESASQSDQIDKLRKQLGETEALFASAQDSIHTNEKEVEKQKAETDRIRVEVEHWKGVAKEEEEKRVKAISLLKSVRQKSVKVEKEKEEATKELASLRDKERGEREKEAAERARLQNEIDTVNAEREKALKGLKAQFDKEMANLKERSEKELTALRGRYEMEALTTNNTYSRELSAKNSQISALEHSVNTLSKDKNTFFDQLQLRQAEVESSQSHLESLQSQKTELEYQLREADERLAVLSEELAEARREQESQSRMPKTSAEDVARLLSTAETKYETKIAELNKNISVIERERNESEADWSRKHREKVKEVEELKRVIESSSKAREQNEDILRELRAEIQQLQEQVDYHRQEVVELRKQTDTVQDVENSAKALTTELGVKIAVLERQIEEGKAREGQLRANNKTLRDELRKVQSSAALLERQRNPGVGYWTSRPENGASEPTRTRTSISSSTSDLPSRGGSPGPTSPSPPTPKNEEDVNLEYLRNVILQFLEHKQNRIHLVKVLSSILRFTPQETRRLMAQI